MRTSSMPEDFVTVYDNMKAKDISDEEIAEILFVHITTLRNWKKQCGLIGKYHKVLGERKRELPEWFTEEWYEEWSKKYSDKWIAKNKAHVSVNTFVEWKRDTGIELRGKRFCPKY